MEENNIETVETEKLQNNEQIQEQEQPVKQKKPKKKKRIGKIIFNIITFILFVVVVLEAAIGIINMQRISNDEDPIWYLSTTKTETDKKTVTEYNLGLYKIVKTDTAKKTTTTLKPFFLND